MKTVEEAAKEFSDKYWLNLADYEKISCFKSGAEFMQKQYEEKLRWMPVEEELPNECTFVLTKYKNTYSVSWYDGEFNEMYNPTHWRPIELK